MYFESTDGREPPVVLLHHGASSLRAWDDFRPEIAGGRRLVAYDRRGFGRSPRNAVFDACLFHRDADDLAALLRRLDAAPAHLVGHSDGATVALLTAARHPALVASVTWIAGHTHLEEPLRELLLASRPARWSQQTAARYHELHGEDWEQVLDNWYRLWTRELIGWNVDEELRAVRAPTLLVHDDADRLAPPAHAEAASRAIPHARLSWFRTGSHHPHRRDRGRFLRELTEHLASAET
ncbi:MAG TPA: alpha/beta fold hydrolase [Gaiellaceae bacterium]|nr:alpha/beta fold hydrolase [Gaiellaceae bacterium]